MKNILTMTLSVLIAIVLTASAVCIGVFNGWHGECEDLLLLDASNTELLVLIDTRAMDAANLAVVASRHLSENDKQLTLLQEAQSTLRRSDADMMDILIMDRQLSKVAAELGKTLPLLTSVQQSPRDQVYIDMLTRTLSETVNAAEMIETRVLDFNTRLTTSVTGKLAMLLGVRPYALD